MTVLELGRLELRDEIHSSQCGATCHIADPVTGDSLCGLPAADGYECTSHHQHRPCVVCSDLAPAPLTIVIRGRARA